jgi:heptosyltransferase-2
VEYSNILVRATNWVGDAVMSLPALRALRERFPEARITVVAKPWVAGLYARESWAAEIIPYNETTLAGKWRFARGLRGRGFDMALLLQNAFEAAAMARVAGVPERIGYNRDGRRWLLTRAVRPPAKGEIPRHERFYYLELLRRAGLMDALPEGEAIRLEGAEAARAAGNTMLEARGLAQPVIGLSPGAAYGSAKRWPAERFAQAALMVARIDGGSAAVFGSGAERELCAEVADRIAREGVECRNLAGETTLAEFIDMAAACRVFLTNDSGSMHIASALGVPTVAVFGATDAEATGPTGPLARVVREPVECSPCLLRSCPIDHRCMTRVSPDRVAEAALELKAAAASGPAAPLPPAVGGA